MKHALKPFVYSSKIKFENILFGIMELDLLENVDEIVNKITFPVFGTTFFIHSKAIWLSRRIYFKKSFFIPFYFSIEQ
jgi:hypothetical protein